MQFLYKVFLFFGKKHRIHLFFQVSDVIQDFLFLGGECNLLFRVFFFENKLDFRCFSFVTLWEFNLRGVLHCNLPFSIFYPSLKVFEQLDLLVIVVYQFFNIFGVVYFILVIRFPERLQ